MSTTKKYKNNLRFLILTFLLVFISNLSLRADTFQIDLSSYISMPITTVEVSLPFQTNITIKNENIVGNTILDGAGASIKYHIPAGSSFTNGNYTGTGWTCNSAVDGSGDLSCTYGNSLTNGQTSNLLTITLTAPSNTGTSTPTATVTATTTDANTGNNTSSTTVEFGKSNLHATKTASKTPLQLNEAFTYTINVKNPDNGTNPTVTARNVQIADTLPSQISFVSFASIPSSWSCSQASGTISCSGLNLAVGTSKSLIINAKATAGGTNITNTVIVTADSADYNAPISANASVNVQLADIVLTSSLIGGIDASNAAVRSNVTYRLHIMNNGASPAYDVNVTDTLPSGVTFVQNNSSANWTCSGTTTINCTLNETSLSNSESYDLDLNVTMPATHGQITNNATAYTTSAESDTNNHSSLTTYVNGADLNIAKTPDNGSADIGTNYIYTIKVTNNGLTDAQGVKVTDTLDSSMTYVSDSLGCGKALTDCSLGTIAAGAHKSFTVTVTMPTNSLNDVTNSANVTTITDQENNTQTSDTAITHITGPNLNITKDANVTEVGLGKTFSYSINIQNVNTADATNADIEDQLPSGVTITSISPDGWNCPSTPITGTFHCTKTTVPGGANNTLIFTATAPTSTTGNIQNTATISHSLNSNDGSDTAIVNVTGVTLDILKTASSTAVAGGIIDYSIKVTNTSHSDAESLTLIDNLSGLGSGYSINSITNSDGWSCSGSTTLTCTKSSLLAEGDNSTILFKVNVPSNATLGTVTNTASVTTTTAPSPNESDTASTTIQGADIVVVPPTTTTAVANENVVFAVKVRNDGNAVAKDVNITNTFNTTGITDGDFTNIKIDCSGGTTFTAVSNNECQLGDINSGATKTITISATAPNYDSAFPGNTTINNRSVTATSTSQSDTGNDNSDWSVEIHGADLVVNKSSDKSEVAVNGIVTYTINVKNQWEATATNVKIDDTTLGSSGDKFTFISGTLNYNHPDWTCTLNSSTHFSCTYKHDLAQNQTTSDITIQAKAPNNINAIDNHRDNQVDVINDTAEKETATTNTKVVPVTIRGADLDISKTVSPNPAQLQQSVTFSITIINNGLADALNAYANDTLLSGFTNITTSGCDNDGSSVSGQSVHCTLGNLAQNASKTFTITTNAPNTNGDYDNTATTASDTLEKDTTNNSDTVTLHIEGADLRPHKTAPAQVAGNSEFTYTISLENIGTSTAYGAEINDTIPSNNGTTYVSGSLTTLSGDWTCSLSGLDISCHTNNSNFNMPHGYNENIVSFKVKAGPAHYWIHNTVVTATSTSESNTANNTYTANTEVINIDLQAAKYINGHNYGANENYIKIQGNLQYKIYVRNRPISGTNPPPLTDVNVTDIIPSNVTNITVTPSSRFTCNTSPFHFPVGNVKGGDKLFCTMNNGTTSPLVAGWTYTLVATVDTIAPDAGHFDVNNENNNFVINRYKAETSFSDRNLNNNAPTRGDGYLHTNTLVRGSNMSIVKSVSGNPIGANKPFSYTLATKNYPRNANPTQHDRPSTDATNIVVKDTLPADVNFTSASGTNWSCSESSHVLTCSYTGDITPGNSTANITVNVTAPNTNAEILTNEANVTNATPELVRLLPDNVDSIQTTTQGTDISITKTGPATAGMSDHIIYSITVQNTSSTADAQNVYVIDTFPNGATYDGNISNSHWTSTTDANGSIRFTYDQNLSAGISASFTFSSTLPHYTGTARNHVDAYTSTAEISTPNVDDWDTDIQGANLVFKNNLTQNPNPVGAYGQHAYYATIHNQGLSPANDINVTIDLNDMGSNPGWSDVNASGTNWTCDPYDSVNTKLICHLPSLAASTDSSVLTINSITPNFNGDITNSATVIGKDDTSATTGETRTVTTHIRGSDLKIKKYAKDPDPLSDGLYHDDNVTVGVGKPVDFKFTVKNDNLGLAKDIVLTDTFPAGFSDFNITDQGDWSCSFSSDKLTCSRSKLAPNTDAQDILVSAKTSGIIGTVTNTADINTSTIEVDNSNNTDNVKIKLEGATLNADLNTSKTQVAMNEVFTYTLGITNSGRNDGIDINVTDILPADLTYVDFNGSDSGWNCSENNSTNTVICTQPLISAYNGNTILKLNVKAPQNKIGIYQNSVEINSNSIENPITAYAPDIQVIGSDLTTSISATPNDVLEDRNVTYVINVKDINISTAYDIHVGQTFSPHASAVYITNDGGADCNLTDSNNSVECVITSLAYNEDKNITITATMPSTDVLIDPLTSTVTVSTISQQEDTSNDSSSADVIVRPIMPVADYRFEECKWNGSAGEVKDSIGTLNGIAKNGAQTLNHVLAADNNFSTAWRSGIFDGSNDYVAIPNSTLINTDNHNKRSISLWFDSKRDDSNRQVIYEEGGGARGLAIYVRSNILYVGGWNKNESGWNGTYLHTSITTNTTNKWHHVVLALDAIKDDTHVQANAFKAYLDGTMFAQGDGSQLWSHGDAIGIGGVNGGTKLDGGAITKFKGYIDEVEIYNIALDAKAVKDIYDYEKDQKNYDGTDRNETICGVDLAVTKTANPSPNVGAESGLDYTITVTNLSSEPLTSGFTLIDELPSGLTIIDSNFSTNDVTCVGSYDFTCTLLPSNTNIMKKNDTRTITLHTIVPNSDGVTLINDVNISTGAAGNTGQPDTKSSNDTASATVITKGTDLSVTKTATLDNNGSNVVHYTIVVKNLSSTTTAKDVSIKDTYDSRLTLITFSGSCSSSGGHSFDCTLPDMPVGSEYNMTSTMTVDTNGTNIRNDVNVTSHTVDAVPSNNHASVSIDVNTTGSTAPVKLKDGFRKHISTNNYGNMIAIGNTILQANNQDGNTSLTDINTSYVNVASQPLDSSSATLNIPENNVTIEYAGLYWGGHIKGKDSNDTLSEPFNQVKLTTPHGSYTITGGNQENSNFTTDDNITGFYRFKRYDSSIGRLYYSSEANVTSIIRSEYLAHNSNINGTFTISDLNVSHGIDNTASFIPDDSSPSHWSFFNSGFFGGWELIVIYSVDHRLYRSVKYKNSTLFDGFKVLMPRDRNQSVSLDINVSGFITPNSGNIESNLFSMVLAGDKTLPFEGMKVDNSSGTPHLVKEGVSNTDNIFNDTITLKNLDNSNITKNLDLAYNPGVDLDQFDLTSNYDANGSCLSSPCYLNNGQTSTKINLQVKSSATETSPGSNQYAAQYAFVDMLGFNTQIFTPDFIDSYKECFKRKDPGSLVDKTWIPCSDTSQPIHRGSIIKYRITIINSGTDDAIDVHVNDLLPKEVDFNGTCSSPNDDINATNIYSLPDGLVTMNSNDPDNHYDDTIHPISGDCLSPQYDEDDNTRNNCIQDLKAILIDANNVSPINTIPDGIGENMDFINPNYNGTSCTTTSDGNTTLKFSFSNFPKKSVAWIDFYTKINSKARLGSSFQNFVAIDFTNLTLANAGIDNLQTQYSDPVDSGIIYFDWENIRIVARDQGRNTVGAKVVKAPFDLNITLNGISLADQTDANASVFLNSLNIIDNYNGGNTSIYSTVLDANVGIPLNTGNFTWATQGTSYPNASRELGFDMNISIKSSDGNYSESKIYPRDFNASAPYAGDVFTTRPKEFTLSLSGPNTATSGAYTIVSAGKTFSTSVKAPDNNDINSTDYNATLSKGIEISVGLDSNFSTNAACINQGDLNISNLTFINGSANTNTLKYKNVGVIKLILKDSNWTAKDSSVGDCNATTIGDNNSSDADGLISCSVDGNSSSIVFKPDHFTFVNNSVTDNNGNFTYMVLNPINDPMFGKITTTIQAKNVDNNITTFFSKTCFANNVNTTLTYNATDQNLAELNISIANDNNLSDSNISNSNINALNNTLATSAYGMDFANGASTIALRMAVERNATTALQPALIQARNLQGSINNYLGINGINVAVGPDTNMSATNDLHFLFGRVHAPDYRFAGNTGTAKVYYEAYCKDCNQTYRISMNILGTESIDYVNWYVNTFHTSLSDGNVTNYTPNNDVTLIPANSTAIANGVESIVAIAPKLPYIDKVDINATDWVTFDPKDFLLEFQKDKKDWAGQGKLGHVIDTNVSTRSNRRLNW